MARISLKVSVYNTFARNGEFTIFPNCVVPRIEQMSEVDLTVASTKGPVPRSVFGSHLDVVSHHPQGIPASMS